MKILPLGTEFFHVDGRTERHTKKRIVFFVVLRRHPKMKYSKQICLNATLPITRFSAVG